MNTLSEALVDVDYAFRHLEFAIKVMCYCELGHLDLTKLDADTTLLFESENVGFPTGHFGSQDDVVPAAQATVGIVIPPFPSALKSRDQAVMATICFWGTGKTSDLCSRAFG